MELNPSPSLYVHTYHIVHQETFGTCLHWNGYALLLLVNTCDNQCGTECILRFDSQHSVCHHHNYWETLTDWLIFEHAENRASLMPSFTSPSSELSTSLTFLSLIDAYYLTQPTHIHSRSNTRYCCVPQCSFVSHCTSILGCRTIPNPFQTLKKMLWKLLLILLSFAGVHT